MSEWWTYRLSDLLLFSPQTYYRLFELYNAAIWPAQVVAIVLGLAVLILGRRPGGSRGRWIAAIFAGCWLWVAIAFHANRYAMINWAAVDFAWGFGFEAALLIWTGVLRGKLVFGPGEGKIGRASVGILLFALLAQPLIGPLLGRPWRQAEIFGVAPDPTAVATLGILLLAAGRVRWELIAVPVIWCAITGATLLAMRAPDAWVTPLAAALAVALAIRKTRARRRAAARVGSAGQTAASQR
jgi:hypothetical protein